MSCCEEKKTLRSRLKSFFSRIWEGLHPAPPIRRAATWGALIAGMVVTVSVGQMLYPGLGPSGDMVGGALVCTLLGCLIGLAFLLCISLLNTLCRLAGRGVVIPAVGVCGAMIVFEMNMYHAAVVGFGFILSEALFAGTVAFAWTGRFRSAGRLKKVLAVLILTYGTFLNGFALHWCLNPGSDDHLTPPPAWEASVTPLDMPNPAEMGPHAVSTLFYGSGTDKWRTEFGKGVDLTTECVDASSFTEPGASWKGMLREWYWGFDHKHFPLNGRVWYPAEDGAFPLVLIVHGNHMMEEQSDPGYEWIGRHLASRGYIAVSVDENFLNHSWPGNLNVETDCRAWILLEHLRVWRDWNRAPDNPFFGKVDMNNIALAGHSRGGEGVAVAASFNRLTHYPDDATVLFDYGFNIRAVIAIAPADGLYLPSDVRTPLKDVNYFVIHGGHDMDVTNFVGLRQYARTVFSPDSTCFKTSLWIYRANHGQFNTIWGDTDYTFPRSLELNRKALMPGKEQRQIGKVFFTAFLDATLKGQREYAKLFRDYRVGKDWLPQGHYISRYEDASYREIAGYREDIDVTTATLPDARIASENLAVWREQALPFRTGHVPGNSSVYVGWHTQQEKTPSYALTLPMPHKLTQEDGTCLVFAAAQADEDPPSENGSSGREPVSDFIIRLTDSHGERAEVAVGTYGRVPPVLRSRFSKVWNEEDLWGRDWEPILQHFEMPLSDFEKANPALDTTRVKEVALLFDTATGAVLILDEIGFSQGH